MIPPLYLIVMFSSLLLVIEAFYLYSTLLHFIILFQSFLFFKSSLLFSIIYFNYQGASYLKENKRLLIYPCGLPGSPLTPYRHGDGKPSAD